MRSGGGDHADLLRRLMSNGRASAIAARNAERAGSQR